MGIEIMKPEIKTTDDLQYSAFNIHILNGKEHWVSCEDEVAFFKNLIKEMKKREINEKSNLDINFMSACLFIHQKLEEHIKHLEGK
jgi:hypothetical protein